ncbi:hypothetical protein [Lederbergia citri]|uniref:Uncharacterized protein n=1 Tax=Lederbergia citri TaxID=2833580 RepID=A0A942TAS5_9BACI|nr:hypothetical protein [Lederbergia citri]MBS4194348.1 hypothetical protein [Lederbergia citri]
MNTTTKIFGALTLSGGLVLGSMVYFNGVDTLNQAKQTISDYANKINIFGKNEAKLVSKINELKALRDDLLAQLEQKNLDEERINQLQEELDEANAQIAEYETQLQDAGERITALENEIHLANELSAELQEVIDSNQVTAEPMTESELNQVLEEDTVEEPVEEDVEEPIEEEPVVSGPLYTGHYVQKDPKVEIVPGIEMQTMSGSVAITNKTGKDLQMKEKPDGPKTTLGSLYKLLNSNTIEVQLYMDGTYYAKITIER